MQCGDLGVVAASVLSWNPRGQDDWIQSDVLLHGWWPASTLYLDAGSSPTPALWKLLMALSHIVNIRQPSESWSHHSSVAVWTNLGSSKTVLIGCWKDRARHKNSFVGGFCQALQIDVLRFFCITLRPWNLMKLHVYRWSRLGVAWNLFTKGTLP